MCHPSTMYDFITINLPKMQVGTIIPLASHNPLHGKGQHSTLESEQPAKLIALARLIYLNHTPVILKDRVSDQKTTPVFPATDPAHGHAHVQTPTVLL